MHTFSEIQVKSNESCLINKRSTLGVQRPIFGTSAHWGAAGNSKDCQELLRLLYWEGVVNEADRCTGKGWWASWTNTLEMGGEKVSRLLTFFAGELGLKGLASSFFEDPPRIGGKALSNLYGLSSNKALGAILSLKAPPFMSLL
jgi:hypothetical protein